LLRELQLHNFKAFERFTLTVGDDAYLVGPNNAGKSTLVSAIRSVSRMLRIASARQPSTVRRDGQRQFRAFPLSGERVGLVEENLRHEFRPEESRLSARFDGGARVVAVWPADAELGPDNSDQGEPFFYLNVDDKRQPLRPLDVRAGFPALGVIPALSPIEHSEQVLDRSYVRQEAEGRVVSRHLRNHLWLLQQEDCDGFPNRMEEFRAFAAPWLPEVEFRAPEVRSVLGAGQMLDLYYREPDRHALKELFWAGDGMQVWVQLLLHVFRLRDVDVLVLDEPDLYLHADLQRRLVRLLDSVNAQTITATHSAEILAEAAPDSIIWIEKSRRRAVRSPRPVILETISDTIGTQFNLRLAKALRSKVVLFVEGKDMRLISSIARTLGLSRLAAELGVAVVPLGGFSNWEHVEPFKWLTDAFLEGAVHTFVVLDRDYRTEADAVALIGRLAALNIKTHVWSRKELESYLLVPTVIVRVSGGDPATIDSLLDQAADELRPTVFSRLLAAELGAAERSLARETVIESFHNDFDRDWTDSMTRLRLAPAKELLSALNRRLVDAGLKPASARRLAGQLRKAEIDPEMAEVLSAVEAAL
jgi:hypothetical protein